MLWVIEEYIIVKVWVFYNVISSFHLPIFKFIVHARDITIAQQHGSNAIIALEPV